MKIHDLEVFCTVAEEESFVKAAHRLYISQSAVTQHIKKIETELGFPLLIRNKHFVKMTAQGEIFHRAARDILLRYQQMLDDCARESGSEHTLRLSYVGSSGTPYLTDLLKRFHELYPECSIVTRRLRPDHVVTALEKNETNLIFTPYDLIADSFQFFFYPLYLDRHYCVMDAANPLSTDKELPCEDLAGKHILLPSKAFRPAHMQQAMKILSREEMHCHLEEAYNIDNAILQVLSNSDSIAIIPGFGIPEHPRLRIVPLMDGIRIRMGLAYRQPLTRMEEAFALIARNAQGIGRDQECRSGADADQGIFS